MKFSQEKLHQFIEEWQELIGDHYEEVAHYKDIKLSPDFETYLKLDQLGSLKCYTLRNDDKKLVGYAFYFVKHNIHYKESLQAVQDIIYLDPKYRGNGFGRQFIDWCDGQLKMEDVQVVYHHVKKEINWGPMLEGMGYELVDYIYGRRLD